MNAHYKNFFKNKVIVIYGGTGSWGQELVDQLLTQYKPREIRIYSRGEHKQFEMLHRYKQYSNIRYIIGDVRDYENVRLAMKNADIAFNLAAMKHVPICEDNTWEAIQTNVIGAQNVVAAALENNVLVAVQVSTDKAVDPINIYGFTKGCAEKLFSTAQRSFYKDERTKFVCVRGGNVLNTNGSVIPLFKHLIKTKNTVTLTSEEMSRYFMRLEEAIKLVLKATVDSFGGEIFVMKMPGVKITNLAEVMIKRLGNKKTTLKVVGIRPGEKMYEMLVSSNEAFRTVEDGAYYVILPDAHHQEYKKKQYKNHPAFALMDYSSRNATQLSLTEIEAMLDADKLLEVI